MTLPNRVGTEFLVNTSTLGDQYDSTVIGLSGGRFLATWTGIASSSGVASVEVRAQIFNADGSKVGTEFGVNTTTDSSQYGATAVELAGGGFVIAWTDTSTSAGDTNGSAVRAQMFNADGTKSGSEFVAPTSTAGNQLEATVGALADGGFVIAWRDDGGNTGDTSGSAVRARLFGSDGIPAGNDFLVNTNTYSFQLDAAVTGLTNGKFVVTWSDRSGVGGDASDYGVKAQMFNADGSKSGGEFLVNQETSTSQSNPTIVAMKGGEYLIAWQDLSATGGDTSMYAVRARIYDGFGVPKTDAFLVNTTTTENQNNPKAALLDDGRVVIVFQDRGISDYDKDPWSIRAQVFDTVGVKSGDEVLVNTTWAGNQDVPAVAPLPDGRFVVTWTDASATGGDTSGDAIRGQIYDAEGGVKITGTAAEDQTLTADTTKLTDPDGLGPLSYQWLRDDVAIAGATADSYTLVQDDVGATIRVVVSYTDGASNPEVVTSVPTATVSNVNDAPTGGVAITGTAQVGQTLTLDMSTLDDDDGLPLSGFDYTWSLDRTPIAGATGTSLLLEGSHAGGTVTVAVGYTDGEGTVETVLSDPTGIVGNAPIVGDKRNNKLVGDAAPDTLIGKGGNDTLKGLQSDDVLKGGTGKDKLLGQAGDDLLQGHGGKDKLYGGTGDDILTGGNQVDTFFFRTRWGTDTITDFDAKGRVHDVLDLSRLGEVKSWNDLRKHHLAQDGDDVVIDAGNSDLIVLEDVLLKHLDKGDFHF